MAVKKVTLKTPYSVGGIGPTTILKQNLEYASTVATGNTAATKIQYQFMGLSPSIGAMTRGAAPLTGPFTQADINSGVINYQSDPNNKTILDVTLTLRVTDLSDPSSPGEVIRIVLQYPIPDNAPVGTVNDLTVKEGSTTTITTANINFTDLYESAAAIFIRIQNWPTEGVILKNGGPLPGGLGPGSEFSMADIIAGKITYKHTDGKENPLDQLQFKVRDTKGKWSGLDPNEIATETDANIYTMKIHIKPSDIPLVVNVLPLHVEQCEEGTINTDLMLAQDEDDPDLTITYTLKKLPIHGILKKNGTPLALNGTWTQADVDNGNITFEQDCSNTPTDEFFFDVAHSKNTIANQRFAIVLIPNLPPVIVITPLQVDACGSGVAERIHIDITDPEGKTPAELRIVFAADTITSPKPLHGMLRINGMTAIPGVTEFTYQDVLDGGLTYVHDCTDHDPLTDAIHFVLYDGELSQNFILPIEIIAKEDLPPYMTVNKTQNCDRAGDVTWDYKDFDFTDDDTSSENVFWELTALPEHGTLFINGVPANVGDKFSRANWETIQWRYVANAPDNSILEDFAYFKLYDDVDDEMSVIDLPIRIAFPAPPPICPELVNTGMPTSYLVIKAFNEAMLYASNTDFEPTDFVWTLVKKPQYGDLMRNQFIMTDNAGQPVDPNAPVDPNDPSLRNIWTSQDILDGKLQYNHTTGTPDEDSFDFTVTNGYCQINGTVYISFRPGLVIVNNNELTVIQEGPVGTISNELLLSTSGNATSTDDIVYKLLSSTMAGKLYLNGVEIVADGTVSFTQTDIDSNSLTYEADPLQISMDRDRFQFEVTDGYETIQDEFLIKIVLATRLTMSELTVGELLCSEILQKNIRVYSETAPTLLVFTVLEPPIHGTLKLGNTELLAGSTFTYEDILNGNLVYCETTEGALLDSFDFSLSDDHGKTITPNTFPIRIIPPPAPELVNNGAVFEPCRMRAITNGMLNVKNLRASFDKSTMIFQVKKNPTEGTLYLNAAPIPLNGTFTLQDIIAGTVTYQSNSFNSSPDSFDFDVADVSGLIFASQGNTFEITFKEVNNPPWLCHYRGLTLFEHETKTITLENLQICDVDLDRDGIDDVDPDSLEDLSIVYEEGQVIKSNQVDENGRVSRTVGVQNPGGRMELTFTVTSGSARAYIRDHNQTILTSTPCQTLATGPVTFTFTTTATSPTITCQVIENCVTTGEDAEWTFSVVSIPTP